MGLFSRDKEEPKEGQSEQPEQTKRVKLVLKLSGQALVYAINIGEKIEVVQVLE